MLPYKQVLIVLQLYSKILSFCRVVVLDSTEVLRAVAACFFAPVPMPRFVHQDGQALCFQRHLQGLVHWLEVEQTSDQPRDLEKIAADGGIHRPGQAESTMIV